MRVYISGLIAVVLLLSSCGSSGKEEVYTITLNKKSLDLKVGEDFMLTASGVPGVEWHAEHPFVASVYGGDITGEHVGKTRIVATYKNATAYCDVTVNTTLPGLLPDVTWAFNDSPEVIATKEPGTFSSRYDFGGGEHYEEYERAKYVMICYYFKNNRLYSVGYQTDDDLHDVLREHYEIVTIDDKIIILHQPVANYYVRYLYRSVHYGLGLRYAPDRETAETLKPPF